MATPIQNFRDQNQGVYDDLTNAQIAYGLYVKQYSDLQPIAVAKALGLTKKEALDFMSLASKGGVNVGFEAATPSPTTGGKTLSKARSALSGFTMGGSDELVAGGVAGLRKLQGDDRNVGDIYQQELERERSRIEQFRESDPNTAMAYEIGGGIANPILSGVRTLKGAFGAGATLGGTGAFLSSDGDLTDRAISAPVGAVLGGLFGLTMQAGGNTISGQIKDYLSRKAQRAAAEGAQSLEQFKDEARRSYQEAYAQGLKITPDAFMDFLMDVTEKAAGDSGRGISKALTPKSAAVFKTMEDDLMRLAKDGMGLEDIDYYRQLANTPAADFNNPAEQRIAGILQSNLDDFVENLDQGRIFGGDPAKASAAIKNARATWNKMRKTEKIEKLLEDAQTYRGGLESGIRNQISTLLRNPKKLRGFTKAEVDLLRQINDGTPIGNLIGNIAAAGFSFTGGRNTFGQGVASAAGGAAALIGAKLADDPMTGAAIGLLLEQTATTGVKYIREMNLQNRVQLYRDIIANGLADDVAKANKGAWKLLEAAGKSAEKAANVGTRGTIAATDQEINQLR